MSLADRVAQWPDQWRQEGRREGILEGRQEGILKGRQEGIRRERALLRRLAELRFGASVAERVEVMIANVDDWDQLAQAGEFIIGAQTSTELMHRMAVEVGPSD